MSKRSSLARMQDRADVREIVPRAVLSAKLADFVRDGARNRRAAIEAQVDRLPGRVLQKIDRFGNAHGLGRADALLLAAIEALGEEG